MAITALLFDTEGTLTHPSWDRVARELPARAKVTARALESAEARVRYAMDAGEIVTSSDEEEPWLRYLHTAIRWCGVYLHSSDLERLRAYHATHNLWNRYERTLPRLLEELSTRFRLGVVSSSSGRARADLERLGLARWFDVIVDAAGGPKKPDPRAFSRALAELRVRPEETAYVGDAYHEDVIGARAAGLLPVLLDPYDLYSDKPCTRIRSLEELLHRSFDDTGPSRDAPTEAALVAAVLAHPDDDGPRLVYADWLGERGDPRGELIAVQCALAKLPPTPIARRNELLARESELLSAHGRAWSAAAGIPHAATGRDAWTCELRRGFVEVVRRAGGSFVDLGERVFRDSPVRELFAPAVYAARLAELIGGTNLRVLVLEGGCDAGPLAELLSSPALRQLERLELVSTDAALAVASIGDNLRELRVLSIRASGLDDRATERLFSTLGATRLTALSLTGNRIGARGVERLLRSELHELEVLDLADNLVGDEGAAVLARGPVPARLVKLQLGCNNIASRGAVALADSTSLGRIREISLGGNLIDDAARRHLIDRLGKAVLV